MPGRRFVAVVFRRPGSPRFGMAVSRKVGNAVVRNRVKRHTREAIRHHREGIVGVDVVFIALPLAATASGVELRAEVAAVLSRLRAG
jgi:ribonuclease P protein component